MSSIPRLMEQHWGWALSIALGVATTVLVIRVLRQRPWRGPRTRYPVVLVHGVLGFDQIGIGKLKQNYFRGVVEHLKNLGIEVYQPRLPASSSVFKRALELADSIRLMPMKRINIIAHSMGGLDARYAISQLGFANRVASLTTIGTPHRGTPVVDLGTAALGENLGSVLGLEAFYDLTTARMVSFNREVKNVRGVRYACVVSKVEKGKQKIHPLLLPSHLYLSQRAGPNDGLVPVSSQRWGKLLFKIKADHWAQIGWSSGFDAPAFYEKLMRMLRKKGL